MTYDYIKSHKKSRLHHFSEKNIFGKITRGRPNRTPSIFNVNDSYYMLLFENFSKYTNKLFGKSPFWRLLVFSVDKRVKQGSCNYSLVQNNWVFLINGVKKLELENSVK